MAVQARTAVLPFVVQAPSPERVQLWGQLAQQATGSEEMSLVSEAFETFWWECQMAFSFGYVTQLAQTGSFEYVVCWMDSLVFEALTVRAGWQRVLRQMASREGMPHFYRPAFQDASQQVEMLEQLVQQVALYALALCEQWGLPVPEHLLAVEQPLREG